MTPTQLFGQFVLYERTKLGWTQQELAKRSLVNRSVIAYIETAKEDNSTSFNRAFQILIAMNKTILDFEAFRVANEVLENDLRKPRR